MKQLAGVNTSEEAVNVTRWGYHANGEDTDDYG